jgi:peptidoglycan LD-endopeptidase CwlK
VDLLLSVALYFAACLAVLALAFLPEVRARTSSVVRQCWLIGSRWPSQWFGRGQRSWAAARGGLESAQAEAAGIGRDHGRWLLIGGLIVAGLPLLVFALRGFVQVDAYDHTASRDLDPRVAALLQGEELVPPPPLPPELFMTREVAVVRPDARYANREWSLLDPEFRRRLLVVFSLLAERHGYEAVLIEGFRSAARQTELAAGGPMVTRAAAFESYHQFGLAADVAFMRQGRIVVSEQDPWALRGYELYGEAARSVGLTWGGDWRSLKDYGHVELRRPGALSRGGDNPQRISGH